jgi:hypothetical protein
MTAKRYQRRQENARKRRFEARARAAGQHIVTARVGKVAYDRLRDLCDKHECTVRDVLEGFLLGTIPPANEFGFSGPEIEYARSIGVKI